MRYYAAGQRLMTSSPPYAVLFFVFIPLSFVRLAATVASASAYTSNLGRVQGRHNSSHHSSTRAEFKAGPCACMHLTHTHTHTKATNTEGAFCLFQKELKHQKENPPVFKSNCSREKLSSGHKQSPCLGTI